MYKSLAAAGLATAANAWGPDMDMDRDMHMHRRPAYEEYRPAARSYAHAHVEHRPAVHSHAPAYVAPSYGYDVIGYGYDSDSSRHGHGYGYVDVYS